VGKAVGKAVRVAISLPSDVLEAVERARRAHGETYSEFISQAIVAWLERQQEQEAIDEYVLAYRQYPESEEEIQTVARQAAVVIAQEPWG
jgi:metal-responsive CopG/Arc/MetJ family transcriptional regulator